MSTIPNVRANRVTAQSVTSNFFQGSNADITNIYCNNERVNNLTVLNDISLNGDININGNIGIIGYIHIQ